MCPDKSVLSEFFDNETIEEKRQHLILHIEKCPFCREVIRGFERQKRFLGNLNEISSPPDKLDRFWIYAGHAYGRRQCTLHRISFLIPAVAVFLLAITFVFNLVQNANERDGSVVTVAPQEFSLLNLDVTPGELDLILSYMEKQRGLLNDVELLLSGEMSVTRYGAPEMTRSTGTKSSP